MITACMMCEETWGCKRYVRPDAERLADSHLVFEAVHERSHDTTSPGHDRAPYQPMATIPGDVDQMDSRNVFDLTDADVCTVAVLFRHLLEPPDLALNPPQTFRLDVSMSGSTASALRSLACISHPHIAVSVFRLVAISVPPVIDLLPL